MVTWIRTKFCIINQSGTRHAELHYKMQAAGLNFEQLLSRVLVKIYLFVLNNAFLDGLYGLEGCSFMDKSIRLHSWLLCPSRTTGLRGVCRAVKQPTDKTLMMEEVMMVSSTPQHQPCSSNILPRSRRRRNPKCPVSFVVNGVDCT